MNPFVPTSLDGALMAVSVGALVLALAAFISLLLSGAAPSWRPLAWALVILFVPIVGPATWFVARRRERSTARGRG
ncbi:PLD nuclease N-terminal domain-containing protein [Curtobacterium sp. 1P10AnD]|uniref:PLD nuclease N-terminal domain-containing protein n=1 Tax=Curtobacterium sp. 1P10AnD TaxID=3132283 RepID=UPI0039A1A6F3